jgi:hypothetical protein
MMTSLMVLTKEFFQPSNKHAQQVMGLLTYLAHCEAPAANNRRDEAGLKQLCYAQGSIKGCLNGVGCELEAICWDTLMSRNL